MNAMNRENLRRTALNSMKGVKTKVLRAKLYCEALEIEGIEEVLQEINALAEQAIELIEASGGQEE